MFSTVLVVCVGNICRSPMAEYLIKQRVADSGAGLKVGSAGLGALVGQGADPLAVEVMREHGIDIGQHRARQLDSGLVKGSELILVMEQWQREEIEQMYFFARGRVHLLGKWSGSEIADPYQKPKASFIEAHEKIAKACDEWCSKLC